MQTMKNQFALLEDFLRCFCITASEASLRFEKMSLFWMIFKHYKVRLVKIDGNSNTRCLKITEKVSFKIASEASYVYIFH